MIEVAKLKSGGDAGKGAAPRSAAARASGPRSQSSAASS